MATITDGRGKKSKDITLKVFDHVKVDIRAEMVEFRRNVSLNLMLD